MNDLISRQAAIDALCDDFCGGRHDCKYYPNCGNLESIKNLHSAKSYVPDMNVGDMISRQDAIDALSNLMDTDGFRDGWAVSRSNVECMLRALPAAQTDLSDYSDKLWRKAYERGKAEGQLEQRTPCDLCKHNPPSSMDGKPCTICPAVPYQREGDE